MVGAAKRWWEELVEREHTQLFRDPLNDAFFSEPLYQTSCVVCPEFLLHPQGTGVLPPEEKAQGRH